MACQMARTCKKIQLIPKNALYVTYGNRLPDAPVSSLTHTVILLPILLLTVTSVRRCCSYLSLETSSNTIFALWVCLTYVVNHTVLTFIASYSCMAKGSSSFPTSCMSLCAFLPLPLPPRLCDWFCGLLLQNSLK